MIVTIICSVLCRTSKVDNDNKFFYVAVRSFSSIPASLLVVEGVKIGNAVPVLGGIAAALCITVVLKVKQLLGGRDEAALALAEKERLAAQRERSDLAAGKTIQQVLDAAAQAAAILARKIK